ncbi:hypothetical protein NIES267_24130 [Calothrix parasitica NIES-267]|uniref:Recombinase RecR n=1 Tax=Calothrix parasitica NIES-267 TaxID=1973488 RepID=A0A1Z4LNY1_9CYAN|nr:hypothetical protein NIES267_24130 [Calothrix parasitica NIES-267]
MTTYILFDEALHILVKAFLASVMLLLTISGIGLAVIETIEKESSDNASPKYFR